MGYVIEGTRYTMHGGRTADQQRDDFGHALELAHGDRHEALVRLFELGYDVSNATVRETASPGHLRPGPGWTLPQLVSRFGAIKAANPGRRDMRSSRELDRVVAELRRRGALD